jgi:hypothetical protein
MLVSYSYIWSASDSNNTRRVPGSGMNILLRMGINCVILPLKRYPTTACMRLQFKMVKIVGLAELSNNMKGGAGS